MIQGLFFIIGAVIIAASVVYTTFTYAGLKRQELNNQARFECAQSSRYTVVQQSGITVWYPAQDLYQKCLEEKNIQ